MSALLGLTSNILAYNGRSGSSNSNLNYGRIVATYVHRSLYRALNPKSNIQFVVIDRLTRFQ
jgi:hypothetical protein